jgi:hypothetical protein
MLFFINQLSQPPKAVKRLKEFGAELELDYMGESFWQQPVVKRLLSRQINFERVRYGQAT